MSGCIESELDEKVIPMVRFFNEHGLPTCMSCQGHNDTNMSLFWIQFHKSVTRYDILSFMQKYLQWNGTFYSNGRFALRLLGRHDGFDERWCYFAATIKAAEEDLQRWLNYSGDWEGVEGERYKSWKEKVSH